MLSSQVCDNQADFLCGIHLIYSFLYRCGSKSLPDCPTCKHNTKAFQCRTLKIQDLLKFCPPIYFIKNKISQDGAALDVEQDSRA